MAIDMYRFAALLLFWQWSMTNEKAGGENGCARQKRNAEGREHKPCTHLACLQGNEEYWRGRGHWETRQKRVKVHWYLERLRQLVVQSIQGELCLLCL